nr:hypothetical protein [Sporolactobacillus vineae]
MDKKISVAEAFQFIQSYGWKPKKSELEQWIKEDPLIQSTSNSVMDESWMERFNDWRRFKGTALEPGISLQEQVNRLLTEWVQMKQEIEELNYKITQLEQKQTGEPPF